MIARQTESEIDASAEVVFAALTEGADWPRWLPVEGFPDGVPESLVQGQRFRQRLRLFGFGDTVETTVIENTAPHRFAFVAKGSYGGNVHIQLSVEPLDETHSRMRIEFEIIGTLPRAFAMVVRRGLDFMLDRSLRDFAEHLRRKNGKTILGGAQP